VIKPFDLSNYRNNRCRDFFSDTRDRLDNLIFFYFSCKGLFNYLTIEYEGFYTVYLNLLEEEPYINLLAEDIALTIDDAKEIALKNIIYDFQI
jgi:hypothetical protein